MIAVVDYGRGNLGSVEKLFRSVGAPAIVTQDARAIDEADAVVFPGDGAFHDTMNGLRQLGLLEPVRRALDGTRPFLGICIGYQLLFSTSEEFGEGCGLDVIPGVVRRFPFRGDTAHYGQNRVPHMGWNRVWHGGALRLFQGIEDGAHFYFVHSYFPVPDAEVSTFRTAWCDYGVKFAAAIETGQIHATQFHPEKSDAAGIRMLKNFAAIVKEQR